MTRPEPSFCPWCGAAVAPGDPRPVCTGCARVQYRDPKVGVGAVVHDDGGRLLLIRRGVPPAKGRWALPAGFVDAGEDPRVAVAREVREETGLEVEVGAVVDVYPGGGRGGASFFLAFRATVTGGALAAGDDATDAAFFALDDLPELAFPSTRAAAGLAP